MLYIILALTLLNIGAGFAIWIHSRKFVRKQRERAKKITDLWEILKDE